MSKSLKSRCRLGVERLEDRLTPATLTVTPRTGVIDPVCVPVIDSAQPGLARAEVRTGGVIQWSLADEPPQWAGRG